MTNLKELDEALGKFDEQKLDEISLTYNEQDLISSAAKAYRDMLPLVLEMVEARKKATQESWHVVGLPWNTQSPFINTVSPDPHQGRAILDCIDVDEVSGETNEDIENEWQRIEAENRANAEFVCTAANNTAALAKILEG